MLARVQRRIELVRRDRSRNNPRPRGTEPVVVGAAAAAVSAAAHAAKGVRFEDVGVVVRFPSENSPHETVVKVVPYPVFFVFFMRCVRSEIQKTKNEND